MELGTGTTESVFLAQEDGSSMLTKLVSLCLINALLTLIMVIALHVSRAMTLLKEDASSLKPTTLNLPISAVLHGTGKTRSASLAQETGLKMLKVLALLSLITAPLMLTMVTA